MKGFFFLFFFVCFSLCVFVFLSISVHPRTCSMMLGSFASHHSVSLCARDQSTLAGFLPPRAWPFAYTSDTIPRQISPKLRSCLLPPPREGLRGRKALQCTWENRMSSRSCKDQWHLRPRNWSNTPAQHSRTPRRRSRVFQRCMPEYRQIPG